MVPDHDMKGDAEMGKFTLSDTLRTEALEALRTGHPPEVDGIVRLPSASGRAIALITRDRSRVIALGSVEHDGETYFIGVSKKKGGT